MDRQLLQRIHFLAECQVFLKREVFKRRRRHKSLCSCQMAMNNDNKLDRGGTSRLKELSSEEPLLKELSSGEHGSFVRFETDIHGNEGVDHVPEKHLYGPENRPKKSLFEITSVVNTENDNRGESVGNEIEDSELDDTLSETQETPTTVFRDQRLSSNPNGSEAPSLHTNTNATSRFKIVKIPRTARSEPHKRGRWTCQEYFDPPPETKIERSEQRISLNNASSKQITDSSNYHQGKLEKTSSEQLNSLPNTDVNRSNIGNADNSGTSNFESESEDMFLAQGLAAGPSDQTRHTGRTAEPRRLPEG